MKRATTRVNALLGHTFAQCTPTELAMSMMASWYAPRGRCLDSVRSFTIANRWLGLASSTARSTNKVNVSALPNEG